MVRGDVVILSKDAKLQLSDNVFLSNLSPVLVSLSHDLNSESLVKMRLSTSDQNHTSFLFTVLFIRLDCLGVSWRYRPCSQ